MDWTQALTILGVFIAGFVYMMSRMDSHKKDIDQKFSHVDDKIDQMQKETNTRFSGIENRLTAMEVEINNMKQRLTTIEGYLVPKKVYRFVDRIEEHEEPKEE